MRLQQKIRKQHWGQWQWYSGWSFASVCWMMFKCCSNKKTDGKIFMRQCSLHQHVIRPEKWSVINVSCTLFPMTSKQDVSGCHWVLFVQHEKCIGVNHYFIFFFYWNKNINILKQYCVGVILPRHVEQPYFHSSTEWTMQTLALERAFS